MEDENGEEERRWKCKQGRRKTRRERKVGSKVVKRYYSFIIVFKGTIAIDCFTPPLLKKWCLPSLNMRASAGVASNEEE